MCGLVIRITERDMLSVLILIILTEELTLREKLGVFSGLGVLSNKLGVLSNKYKKI